MFRYWRSSSTLCGALKSLPFLLRTWQFLDYGNNAQSGNNQMKTGTFKELDQKLFRFQLIAKINEEFPNLEQCEETKQIEMHKENTLAHIKARLESNESGLEVSFAGIVIQ